MSTRWKRVVREGETHTGARTTQSYIAGIGVSGALLAGAAVTLVSLVGLVSFQVWPGTPVDNGPAGQAELNLGEGGGQAKGGPVSAASGLIPSSSTLAPGTGTGGDNPGGGPGGKGPGGKGPSQSPPTQPVATPLPEPVVTPQPVTGGGTNTATGTGRKPVVSPPKVKIKPVHKPSGIRTTERGGKTTTSKSGSSGTRAGGSRGSSRRHGNSGSQSTYPSTGTGGSTQGSSGSTK